MKTAYLRKINILSIEIFYSIISSAYNRIVKFLIKRNFLIELTFFPKFPITRARLGKIRLMNEFRKAQNKVPAYKVFLSENKFNVKKIYNLISSIPVMDKENYIKQYPIDARCLSGKIPTGSVIDESSGSSGPPTNWVRGIKERNYNQEIIRFSINRLIPDKNKIIINAFALGPWATGMNISSTFEKSSILKSLGPDIEKIKNTILSFGTEYTYIIMGYPPFLKKLSDQTDIKWHFTKVYFIFGGEAMSEFTRRHIIKNGIKKVYGSYGASDLELNIAAENDFCIELRNLILTNKKLADKILPNYNVPMIFQYNPADFYLEVNHQNELIVSICRPDYIMPKIRYNIHDLGKILTIKELKKIMTTSGLNTDMIKWPELDLPLLFHYGRSDDSVSFYGCKISPQHIHDVLSLSNELNAIVSNFYIKTFEDNQCNKKLEFHFELKKPEYLDLKNQKILEKSFINHLSLIHQDFKESLQIAGAENKPMIFFKPNGHEDFKNYDFKIKHKYII